MRVDEAVLTKFPINCCKRLGVQTIFRSGVKRICTSSMIAFLKEILSTKFIDFCLYCSHSLILVVQLAYLTDSL